MQAFRYGLLSGRRIENGGGRLNFCLPGSSGDIFAPDDGQAQIEIVKPVEAKPVKKAEKPRTQPKTKPVGKKPAKAKPAQEPSKEEPRPEDIEIPDIPYDLMTVEQLQAVILAKMAKNGPVTERMRRDVLENIWHNSLVNWANSFR